MKLEFSGRIFENSVQLSKFHDNNPSGSRVVPYGRTDRQTDMIEVNSRFSQVCEHAKKISILPTECIYMSCIVLHNRQSVYS